MPLLELFKMAKATDNDIVLSSSFETLPQNVGQGYVKKIEMIIGLEVH